MNRTRTVLYSLLITSILWIIFSWPLPRYFTSGIPASSTNIERHNSRFMVNGDHLQLHYFYWLFSDMVKGNTPWFHNLYEFNEGDDSARYNVGNYNVPFSPIYVFWDMLGTSAFAWNMLAFTTIWLTYLATWLLLRRFVHEPLAAVFAIAGISLPYRYITLFGGSPMGHAMLWPPLIVLGLDMAVRDLSFKGALLAAAVLLSSYYNDTRVFLFSVLTAPIWCFLAVIRRDKSSWTSPGYWWSVFLRLLPFALVVLGLIAAGMRVKSSQFSETALAGGRAVSEVALFSPTPQGLFQWFTYGRYAHAFIGFALPVLLLLGLACSIFNIARRRQAEHWRQDLSLLILTALAVGIAILALGPNGPFGGFFYMMARRFLPAYDLMRMTAQVYCVMPTVLAVAGALAMARLLSGAHSKKVIAASVLVAGALFATEHALQVRTTVCRLPFEQGAYAAVADDANSRDKDPHVMIIPIWPGDSAWSALYMHYASLYHIRMLNGYSPQVRNDYVENIFTKLGRSNVAVLPDENLDFLLERDIDYIILHEDAFPEQVSPFPVAFTIKRLLNHPRLQMLAREGSIWSFRILTESKGPQPEIKPEWDIFFPTLHWELEHWMGNAGEIVQDDTASGRSFVRLEAGGEVRPRPFRHWGAPDAALLVRLRGEGVLEVFESRVDIDSNDWKWQRIPLPSLGTSDLAQPLLRIGAGEIDLDSMLYLSGDWEELDPGQSLRLPAAIFFHAGHLDMETDGVVLRRDHEPDAAIVYGPNLPISAGRYRVRMDYKTDADDGIMLGTLRARIRGSDYSEAAVVGGRDWVEIEFEYPLSLPLRCEFIFDRNADVKVESFTITRI